MCNEAPFFKCPNDIIWRVTFPNRPCSETNLDSTYYSRNYEAVTNYKQCGLDYTIVLYCTSAIKPPSFIDLTIKFGGLLPLIDHVQKQTYIVDIIVETKKQLQIKHIAD